jgi:hypothetical protein
MLMEQMLTRLLKEIKDEIKKNMDVEMKEGRKASQEQIVSVLYRMNTNQEKMDVLIANMKYS